MTMTTTKPQTPVELTTTDMQKVGGGHKDWIMIQAMSQSLDRR